MLARTNELPPDSTTDTRPVPAPPKTKAWLPATPVLASMPARSMQVAAGDAGALEGEDGVVQRPDHVARAGRRLGDDVEVEDVGVEPAVEDVGAAAAAQHVVAVAAGQIVVAVPADQHVAAASTHQLVVALATGERVGLTVALQDVVEGGPGEVLDADVAVAAPRRRPGNCGLPVRTAQTPPQAVA